MPFIPAPGRPDVQEAALQLEAVESQLLQEEAQILTQPPESRQASGPL